MRVHARHALVAFAWIGGLGSFFLLARGTANLLVVPLVLVAFVLHTALLATLAAASLALFDTLRVRFPPQRLLWMIPLADLAISFSALLGTVGGPSWLGRYDYWKDLVGVPPTSFTRLVTSGFVLLFFQVAYLFGRMVGRFLRDPTGPGVGSADRLTSLACTIGLVVVPVILVAGRLALPQNLTYMKAWFELGLAHRPQEALELFGRVVDQHPGSDLVDSCLHRMARIEIEVLGRPADARAHLEKLIATCPHSPLVDDALFDLGELALGEPADPARAASFFERILREFPASYLRERATLGLARCQFKLGRAPRAMALLDDLLSGKARRFTVVEDSDGDVRIRLTRDMALELAAGH